MDAIDWIKRTLAPEQCTSERFIYDDMESQSGGELPIVHRPFDTARRSHWNDRGHILDFLLATQGEGGGLLDYGPGDGWPSRCPARS